MATSIKPVILCGGSGTRLWPESRDTMPKQFATLLGGRSTFQETVLRVRGGAFDARPLVVTSRDHRFIVERQLAEIDVDADLLLEPLRRDTGPAILAAACHVASQDQEALALMLPADHVVSDVAAFHHAVESARALAEAGRLVIFGVRPTHPSTEYGYVCPGRPLKRGGHAVARFIEKPPLAKAERLLARNALWNAGNFLFRVNMVIVEYARHDPATFVAVRDAVMDGNSIAGARELNPESFARAGSLSFDYAVMERTRRAAVVPLDCGWSDIGCWDAIWSLSPHNADGNVPNGNVELVDTRGCYAASNGPVTSLVGVENLVVVAYRDAVLVADRRRSREVKNLVEIMKTHGHPEAWSHARIDRPWGWYESLERGEGYQVKRIVVRPGGRLSLQTHRFRAEHWVVVSGEARVTVGDTVDILKPGEHVHIPLGAVHRLENFGRTLVELIEVQNGSYLGEDDIVRLEDAYQRGTPDGPNPAGLGFA